MKALSVDVVQSQLPKSQKHLVTDDVLQEINKLAEDPDYGPEFLDTYLHHMNAMAEVPNSTHSKYLNAIKFFTLVEAGNNLTDAYIKTFPERFNERTRNQRTKDKAIMRGEASRFNNSMLVNEIRKISAIPVHLIHRNILHEAILAQADLMRTAKSEMVRQKAAACLITELKPTEDHVLSVRVDDGSQSVIEQLRKATEELAAAQHRSVQAGVPLRMIAESNIIDVTPEEVESGS